MRSFDAVDKLIAIVLEESSLFLLHLLLVVVNRSIYSPYYTTHLDKIKFRSNPSSTTPLSFSIVNQMQQLMLPDTYITRRRRERFSRVMLCLFSLSLSCFYSTIDIVRCCFLLEIFFIKYSIINS
jgi:hypothetical protein